MASRAYPFPLWTLSGTRSATPDAWTEAFDWRYRLLAYYAERRGVEPDTLRPEERTELNEWLRSVRDGLDEHPWRYRRREMLAMAREAASSALRGGPGEPDFRGDCVVWTLMEHGKEGVEAPNLDVWLCNVLGWDSDLAAKGASWLTRYRQRRRVERRLRSLRPDVFSGPIEASSEP